MKLAFEWILLCGVLKQIAFLSEQLPSVTQRPERKKKADPLQRETLLTGLGWWSFPVSRLELNTDSLGVLRPWWLSNQALMWSVLLLFRPQTWTTTEPLGLLALSLAHCKYGNSSTLVMYFFSFLSMLCFQILLLPFQNGILIVTPFSGHPVLFGVWLDFSLLFLLHAVYDSWGSCYMWFLGHVLQ